MLIVGAGVVGLSASLFLAQHNIKSIVVERRAGPSVHPRARSVNQRTVELFRHLGIDELVREAGKSIANSMGIFVGPSLEEVIGPQPRSEQKRKFPLANIAEQLSPASGTFVTQDMLEPVLVATAKERGVDIRVNLEYQSFVQSEDRVEATFRHRSTHDTKTETISANYLIASDGAKSSIRRQLEVRTTGRGTMGHLINVLFRADLAGFVKGREFSLLKVQTPQVTGLFTSINNRDRWVFHLSYGPGENVADYTEERCKKLVQLAAGMPDLDVRIESLLPWEPSVNVATQLRHGRVFLAGDSAHQMPPWAGQGANTGITDAHNLAWKLALVLREVAHPSILDTYDTERQSVGRVAAEASAFGADERGLIDADLKKLTVIRGFLKKMPLVAGFGYGYQSQCVCYENTWPLGGLTWLPWSVPMLLSLDGRPGRRAPHVWVERNGKRVSTIDVLGTEFVVLAGQDGGQWKEAAREVSLETNVQIDAFTLGPEGDLRAKGREFDSAAGITSRGALLVRPDDFVAARWRRGCADPRGELERAMKQVLHL